jgi:hypothetical protein
MTMKKVPATPRQIDRLFAEVSAVPRELVGAHLTDDQFLGYSMNPPLLGEREMSEANAHLASCDECLGHMEHLFEIAEALPQTQQAQAGRARSVDKLAGWLRDLPSCPAALPVAAASVLEHTSPDGSEHILIADDGEQNLRVVVSSYDEGLQGARMFIEPFGSSIVFERVAPDQVGGEVVIPRSERLGLPMEATVRLSLKAPSES